MDRAKSARYGDEPSLIRSAIDRIRRASDRGNVQDVQMQFQQSQRETVGPGDAFVMADFQTCARQRTVVEDFFQRAVAHLACAVEIGLPRRGAPRGELQADDVAEGGGPHGLVMLRP